MWMDFNLSEKLNQVELPADIHEGVGSLKFIFPK